MRTNHCRPGALRPVGRLARTWLPAAALLVAFAAGCGSDGDSMTDPDDDTDPNGNAATFSVTVTGAESFTSGGDYAVSGGSAAENGWELQLGSLSATNPLQSLRIDGQGDRPGTGTYTIVSPAGEAGPNEFYGRITTTAGEIYYATGGTLTVEASTDAVVRGSFAFPAESSGGASVDVTGTFRADDLLDE